MKKTIFTIILAVALQIGSYAQIDKSDWVGGFPDA
jgi:hypothetical protein